MNSRKASRIPLIAVAIAATTFSLAVCAQAQTETILHNFNNGATGGSPQAGLLMDASGNLYGTTEFGGSKTTLDSGVVFRLTLTGGYWQETVLMDFPSEVGSLGGLIQDAAGNLYGVSTYGGITAPCPATGLLGCGTVFELSPTTTGHWKRTQLYAFSGGADGSLPLSTLVFDSAGNLYGTTGDGGDLTDCPTSGCGVVFKLSPTSSGAWTESVLYAFTNGTDGALPRASLVFDAAGNLYGTAEESRPGAGVVYELSPTASGPWTETVLYTFTGGADGALPLGGLIFDPSGNLYGTTYEAGNLADCRKQGCGTVFELSPIAGGGWSETTIHTFAGGTDGANPEASLLRDASGNLYGTTSAGGGKGGTVFELSPGSGGTWTEKIIYAFKGPTTDGQNPGYGPLIFDAAGNLYGTTLAGGPLGYGTVYKIRP
jgi:uncharacterized repeat protein (TIGR03803 family)